MRYKRRDFKYSSIRGLFASGGCLIIAVFLIYPNIYYCGFSSKRWPTVSGTIISSKIDKKNESIIEYEYFAGNQKFISNRICCDDSGFHYKYAGRFQAGKKVTVFYRSSLPEISVLKPGISYPAFYTGLVFGVMGIIILLIVINIHRGQIA